MACRRAPGLLALVAAAVGGAWAGPVAADPTPAAWQAVAPEQLDAAVTPGAAPHAVDGRAGPGTPLLVWLPGTNGLPSGAPRGLMAVAAGLGYRIVALSYPNAVAVAQVCTPQRLRRLPDCALRVRQHRVWGDLPGALIDDRPADAIVPRLTALLRWLALEQPAAGWSELLEQGQPRWDRIVLAGQSQGGGHAAFLAQTRAVAGVLMFSGGWDHGAGGQPADWYRRTSATPAPRWHASWHVEEPQAQTLAQIAALLGVPPSQAHALDLPVRGRLAHGEGIGNPGYAPLWRQMLEPARDAVRSGRP